MFLKKVAKKFKNIKIIQLIILTIVLITLPLIIEAIYRLSYKDLVSHNVFYLGTNISEFDKSKFIDLVSKKSSAFSKIILRVGSNDYSIDLSEIGYSIDVDKSWQNAKLLKKTNELLPIQFSFINYFQQTTTTTVVKYNQSALDNEINKITSLVTEQPKFETLSLENGKVIDIPGKDGYEVDNQLLNKEVTNSLKTFNPIVMLNLRRVSANYDDATRNKLNDQAKNLIGKKITIELNKKSTVVSDAELISTLNDREVNNFENIKKITKNIAEKFNQETKDSVFIFENGKVTEFIPSQEGVLVDQDILAKDVVQQRDELINSKSTELSLDLPYTKTQPEITTGSINNLGIKEMIGHGESTFRGSAVSRIHNIKLASSKFNGVLVAPGETFSFNDVLGDVSKFTGYEQAYIIKDGQTVLGDGGGVCQVSTTMFRAALDSGLPIVERRSHSYRVSYYEQNSGPGLDATVFSPTTDFRFKNDTGNYILIQTVFDASRHMLTFDFYGTSDGRIATVSKPVIKEVTPPPEDLYIDDPTLKVGVVKQIDYKAWGAKVYFNYKVTREGQTIYEKIFYSNYLPWQAKFLRGTAT